MENQYRKKCPVQYCWDCGESIRDKYLLYAMDRYWHTSCLRCSVCRITLADAGSSCFTRSGLILCRDDYLRLFGREGECHACRETIPANEMVMKVQGLAYHLKCFICSRCHGPLSLGDRYHLWEGRILCDKECLRLLRRNAPLTQRRATKAQRLNSTIKA
ncbi:LIM domain transcription factor LMO4-B-like [Uloborus diversus]|uniref:LIM domain transcription factor LMO4-B-like n=1 Tax=Uloborus diversus TaxID=327109 RepID=UPI00240A9458|nr:LIM domain transcription factor LMO4-B-like [Uloborus diversus]